MSGPTLEQRRNGRAELLEQIAELTALLRVQRNIGHAVEVYGPSSVDRFRSHYRTVTLAVNVHTGLGSLPTMLV